nr:protein WEAK CHLOROPLAST MOVEMENT UNDER BLUE LIGHT-like 1 [Aegilops tauschii subsp. strangulata]
MGTVVEKVQSAKSRLNEAFTSMLPGFEASLLVASARDVEVSELQQKLKLADGEIDRINKRFDESQGNTTEVEALKSALAEAKEEARASKAAAEKVAMDAEAEKATRLQYEVRVTEVEQALQEAANKCESLEESNKAQEAELSKALQEAKEARSESRAAREEIKQAELIAAGKPVLLQSIFGGQSHALLNRLWSAPDAFADLPRSAANAAQYLWAQDGNATEKLFCSQYLAPEQPALLNNQMM